jgi:hypothetical protein
MQNRSGIDSIVGVVQSAVALHLYKGEVWIRFELISESIPRL